MKTMIIVWGASNRGKSQGIKALADAMPFSSIITPWGDQMYDSYVIGNVKDDKGKDWLVGIESFGDPSSDLKFDSDQVIMIKECVKAGCEIIVAASRSYGTTWKDAKRIAKANGYNVIQVTTIFCEDGPELSNGVDLRSVFAENMVSLVKKCLQ